MKKDEGKINFMFYTFSGRIFILKTSIQTFDSGLLTTTSILYIPSMFSRNSEANASEFPENLEEVFSRYYIYNVYRCFSRFKSSLQNNVKIVNEINDLAL